MSDCPCKDKVNCDSYYDCDGCKKPLPIHSPKVFDTTVAVLKVYCLDCKPQEKKETETNGPLRKTIWAKAKAAGQTTQATL